MCKLPRENAYVERIQGTMEYEYLFEMKLTDYNKYNPKKTIHLCNDKRQHTTLRMMTPTAFEQVVEKMDGNLWPKLKLYQWNHD